MDKAERWSRDKNYIESGIRWWEFNEQPYNEFLRTRWNPRDIEEFKRTSFHDLMPYRIRKQGPGYHTFIHENEIKQSQEAYQKNITNYEPNSFQYYINEFGFRGQTQPIVNDNKKTIGFFGCSFTFGIGMPAEKHFVEIVGNHFNLTTFNFGVPGGSASRMSRIFHDVTRFQKLDYAFFLFPHINRMEWPVFGNNEEQQFLINLILNYRHTSPEEDVIREKLSNSLTQEYLKYDLVRNLMFINNIGKLTNTKVFYSSWDIPTFDLIYTVLKDEIEIIFPWYQFVEYKDVSIHKKGRDGVHPGDETNRVFAERCKAFLENHIEK